MALSDETIVALNPWWTNPQWGAVDPHLRALDERRVRLAPAGFVSEIEIGRAGTHIVRGPRQVGKSTGLKLLAERAHEKGLPARNIIYLSFDLLEDQPLEEVARTISRARRLAGADGNALLLLDEVTAVPKWAKAVKATWDNGTIRSDTVVCTGSSALDLADGEVEGLPGRRGGGRDFLVSAQSFAEFARALDSDVPVPPHLSVTELADAEDLLASNLGYLGSLQRALVPYLRFGGLPAAVGEAAAGEQTPSGETCRVVWDSVTRELRRHGASEVAVRALLERVVRSLGAKTNWAALAREMDVPLGGRRTPPDNRSVRDFIEILGRSYELMVVYFRKPGSGANDLARDKKVYFADPLLHHVTLERTPGLGLDESAAVENAVATALYRRYEPFESQTDGLAHPTALHVWETSTPREIDFACGPPGALELVEVKYRRSTRRADSITMRRAFPGRPAVVVSKNELRYDGDHVVIPAALMLWALG